MTLKQLIAALLLAVILISSVSCTPSSPQNGTDVDPSTSQAGESTQETSSETRSETTSEENDEQVVLYKDGKWQYRIVTRAVRSSEEIDFSLALTKEMIELTGSAPTTANDLSLKDESVCEIIIGCTKHPAMRSIYSTLGYGDACIRVEGNKIYVAAFSTNGFEALQAHISKLMKASFKDGCLTISAKDTEALITVNEELNTIPTASAGEFSSIVNCGSGQTLIIINDSTESVFDSYVEKLKGYTCVSSVSEAGNRFATFDFGDHLLNVSHSKGDSRLRIILNKNTEPTALFAQGEESKKVCEPLLIMHGLAWKQSGYTYYGYGMCMLIRLHDGRFIVIDGGFNRRKDADDLYALLTKYNVLEGKPTIAMWILTHAHIDHHGTFAFQFHPFYKNSVTVENVLFNPPGGDILTAPENESVTGLISGQMVVNNTIRGFQASNIRSHVGDRYYVGDSVIDIIYTVDQQYPNTFNYYNTCSMILSITIAGQRIMITGDASNVAFGKAVKMFGSSLKSDMVQVAHHGGTSGVSASEATSMSEGYKLMSPSVVLWPASDESYAKAKKTAFNKVLLALPTVKSVEVAGDRDFVVTLPYNP